jgi:MFS family permease
MTTTTAQLARRRTVTLSRQATFWVQISILVLLLAASSAPTPLYSVFQAKWGFSPITVTVVFGVYALAVLAALLIVGKLSDHVGRRPVLLAALVVQLAALAVFVTASDLTSLLVARIVQGLSTGAAVGALGAGLLDIDKTTGTVANGVAPITGTATGALLSGLVVQYLPAPTRLIFEVLIVAFVLEAVAVILMPETTTPKAGALRSLQPQVALPRVARRPMLVAIPALVAVWSLAGFYASLGPELVRMLSGSDSFVLGALSLTILAGTAAITVLVVRDVAPRTVMLLGVGALLAGSGLTLLSVQAATTTGFFIGTAVAGVGFGAGFQGGLRTVLPLAAEHERAGVLSMVYIVSYLAFGLPAVAAGVLVEHVGVRTTAREYTVVVMALAAAALAGLLVRRLPAAVGETSSGVTSASGVRAATTEAVRPVSRSDSEPRRSADQRAFDQQRAACTS